MVRPYILKGMGDDPREAVEDLEKVFSYWEGKHYQMVGNLIIEYYKNMFYAFQTITWDKEAGEYEEALMKKLKEKENFE